MNNTTAGWYPDPTLRFELRYHNGAAWTADVSNDGVRFVDPMGTQPSPHAASRASGASGAKNGVAIASMVLGIVAIAVGWIPFVVVLGVVAAILAVVFGVVGRRRARVRGVGGGFALAGLITGGAGLLVCVGGGFFTAAMLRAFDRFENPAANEVMITSCTRDGDDVTATGVLTNLDEEPSDFAVRVYFVREGTDNPRRQAVVELVGVAPGDATTFEVTRAVVLDDVDCIIGAVRGPLPYGIDPGT